MRNTARSTLPARLSDAARLVQPLAAAIPISIFSASAIALPLATAQALGLSERQTAAWIAAQYGLAGLLSMVLTVVYRQPLFVAWHTAVVIFMASLAGVVPYSELLGAMLVAGMVIALIGAAGLTPRVAALVPIPIVFGVVAGNVLPFVVGTFEALGAEPLLVGGALGAYLLGRRFLSPRVPAILPALVAGVALAATTGRLHPMSRGWTWPEMATTAPEFGPAAILTIVPVAVPLIALHSNLTAVAYLRSQGYDPPARAIEVATGLGTAVGSLFGPTPICMGALVTPLTAGPEAGERAYRPWAVYGAAAGFLVLAAGASIAAEIPDILPLPLLLAVAGLALLGVLDQALRELTRGPLRLGPLVALAVALSPLSLFGVGPAFWAIVFGTLTSWVLENEHLRLSRAGNRLDAA